MWRHVLHQPGKSIRVGGAAALECTRPALLLPGSFNPLHDGHREMARIAAARLGQIAEYELSVTNVDKPSLSEREIERRLSQFETDEAVWLTRAPTFLEKSRQFPGATFVVGADTIARISNPRYYANSRRRQEEAVQELAKLGCRFLVFGRVADGEFRVLSQLHVGAPLLAICDEVGEADFRLDVSATQIRQDR